MVKRVRAKRPKPLVGQPDDPLTTGGNSGQSTVTADEGVANVIALLDGTEVTEAQSMKVGKRPRAEVKNTAPLPGQGQWWR